MQTQKEAKGEVVISNSRTPRKGALGHRLKSESS